MYLFTFYATNLYLKWRFKRGALTGKICQKWGDYALTERMGEMKENVDIISPSDAESSQTCL